MSAEYSLADGYVRPPLVGLSIGKERVVGTMTVSPAAIQALLAMDENGDNEIEFEEFQSW